MNITTNFCRRQHARVEQAIQVRFSVNGGPEQSSDTINFTNRSLAIRSHSPVVKGDHVTVTIDQASPLEGIVVRAWEEGFAITLTPSALAQSLGDFPKSRSLARAAMGRHAQSQRFCSPVFELQAEHPTCCRIASTANGRHKLSIVTTASIEAHAIRSLWLSVAQTRWIARIAAAGRRGGYSIIVLRINNWQLQMAAQFGLSMSVIQQTLEEWKASTPAGPVLLHVNSLSRGRLRSVA